MSKRSWFETKPNVTAVFYHEEGILSPLFITASTEKLKNVECDSKALTQANKNRNIILASCQNYKWTCTSAQSRQRLYYSIGYWAWLYTYRSRRYKTCLWGFQQSESQTSLLIYRDFLEIEISLVASLDIILSNKRITKAPISLCRCASWSAPLLFANPQRQVFSHRGPYAIYKPS